VLKNLLHRHSTYRKVFCSVDIYRTGAWGKLYCYKKRTSSNRKFFYSWSTLDCNRP